MLFPNKPDPRWFQAPGVNARVESAGIKKTDARMAAQVEHTGVAPVVDRSGVVVDERGRVVVSAIGELYIPLPCLWSAYARAQWDFTQAVDYGKKIFYADADDGREISPHTSRTYYGAAISAVMSDSRGYVRATFSVSNAKKTACYSIVQPSLGVGNRVAYSTLSASDWYTDYNGVFVAKSQLTADASTNFSRFQTAVRQALPEPPSGTLKGVKPISSDDVFMEYKLRTWDSKEFFPYQRFIISTDYFTNMATPYTYELLSCATTIDQTIPEGESKKVSGTFEAQSVTGFSFWGFCFTPAPGLRVKLGGTHTLRGHVGNLRGKNIKCVFRVWECLTDGLLTDDERDDLRYEPVKFGEKIGEVTAIEIPQEVNQYAMDVDVDSEEVRLSANKLYAIECEVTAEQITETVDAVNAIGGKLNGTITQRKVKSVSWGLADIPWLVAWDNGETAQTYALRSTPAPVKWFRAAAQNVQGSTTEEEYDGI